MRGRRVFQHPRNPQLIAKPNNHCSKSSELVATHADLQIVSRQQRQTEWVFPAPQLVWKPCVQRSTSCSREGLARRRKTHTSHLIPTSPLLPQQAFQRLLYSRLVNIMPRGQVNKNCNDAMTGHCVRHPTSASKDIQEHITTHIPGQAGGKARSSIISARSISQARSQTSVTSGRCSRTPTTGVARSYLTTLVWHALLPRR